LNQVELRLLRVKGEILKLHRIFVILPILLLVIAITVRSSGDDHVWVALTPVAYEMKVPADIAGRITVQDQVVDAAKSGAVSVVTLSYQPIEGEKAWFMTAYYFIEKELDKTIFPDQVPPYGFKVMAQEGMALSVIGPQESIYEINSEDGKNYTKLYDILYDADSYRFVG
jgi:hypothetical protein